TGVDLTDFTTTTGGGLSGASVTGVSGSGAIYTVTVDTGTGDGTVRLNVINDNSIMDAMLLPLSSSFTSGEVYTVSKSDPFVVSITRVEANPTNLASVHFTVNFSKPVTGVDNSDFALTNTGTIAGATVTGVSGANATYTVTVNTGSGNGTIRLDLHDDDTIVDSGNRPLGGTGVFGSPSGDGSFTGQVFTIDKTQPTVTINQKTDPPAQADPVTGPSA